jgi:hypothetical protein
MRRGSLRLHKSIASRDWGPIKPDDRPKRLLSSRSFPRGATDKSERIEDAVISSGAYVEHARKTRGSAVLAERKGWLAPAGTISPSIVADGAFAGADCLGGGGAEGPRSGCSEAKFCARERERQRTGWPTSDVARNGYKTMKVISALISSTTSQNRSIRPSKRALKGTSILSRSRWRSFSFIPAIVIRGPRIWWI